MTFQPPMNDATAGKTERQWEYCHHTGTPAVRPGLDEPFSTTRRKINEVIQQAVAAETAELRKALVAASYLGFIADDPPGSRAVAEVEIHEQIKKALSAHPATQEKKL